MFALPPWLKFFPRQYHSANMVLIHTDDSILFDSGYGGDVEETERILTEAGVHPRDLWLIVNSHFHGDHCGGNHTLQEKYSIPVAAHPWEGDMVNRRDPNACDSQWLHFPAQSYSVNRFLADGEEIRSGDVTLQVIHTPGHTLGHIALFEPESRILMAGDACHSDDVPWLGLYRHGSITLYQALATLDKLAALNPLWMCSGHGPATDKPIEAIDNARRKFEAWLDDPKKMAWHAIKRIGLSALMLADGMTQIELETQLPAWPWFIDYCQFGLEIEPLQQVPLLIEEWIRIGAAGWQGEKLMPLIPYTPHPREWADSPIVVKDWAGLGYSDEMLTSQLRHDLEETRSIPELIQTALQYFDDGENHLGSQAEYALCRRAAYENYLALQSLAKDEDVHKRFIGIYGLADFGLPTNRFYPQRMAFLFQLLESETDPQNRLKIAHTLARYDDSLMQDKAFEVILAHKDDPNWDIRWSVAINLPSFEARAIPALIQLSEDEDDVVRDWATFGLGRQLEEIDTPEIRAALWKRVTDSDFITRSEAFCGLVIRDDKTVIPALIEDLFTDAGILHPDNGFVDLFCDFLVKHLEDIQNTRLAEILQDWDQIERDD